MAHDQQQQQQPQLADADSVTILVVTDDADARREITQIIERDTDWQLTFAPASAKSVLAALSAGHQPTPNVLLTDLQITDLDGLAFIETLRKKHPNVPVVLLTRHESDVLAFQALRRGAVNY